MYDQYFTRISINRETTILGTLQKFHQRLQKKPHPSFKTNWGPLHCQGILLPVFWSIKPNRFLQKSFSWQIIINSDKKPGRHEQKQRHFFLFEDCSNWKEPTLIKSFQKVSYLKQLCVSGNCSATTQTSLITYFGQHQFDVRYQINGPLFNYFWSFNTSRLIWKTINLIYGGTQTRDLSIMSLLP